MRIDYVNIDGFKNLNRFELNFTEQYMTHVLLGQNATGKSNFIEALILIFKYLDLEKEPDPKDLFNSYTIKYMCRGFNVIVQYNAGKYSYEVDGVAISKGAFTKHKKEYLPKYIFTYYSGSSNKLEHHFDTHQSRFYRKIISKSFKVKDMDDYRRLFYVRLIHSYFVLLAFFSFAEDQKSQDFLKKYFGIVSLESALLVLKKPNWKGKGTDVRFWKAIGLAQKFLDDVWLSSIAPIKDEIRVRIDPLHKKTVEVLYLFISNQLKLHNIASFYKNNTDLFKAIESTYISDLLHEVRIKVKKNNVANEITFNELSEGEQQLLTVIGLLKFTKDEESLVLLDEPDTHLNPRWKWDYLELLNDLVLDGQKDNSQGTTQIVINTHDPLVIGGLLKEQVRVFELNKENGHVSTKEPDFNPQGMGVAGILTSDMFDLPTTMDKVTQDDIDEQRQLRKKRDSIGLTDTEADRLFELDKLLEKIRYRLTSIDPLYDRFLQATELVDELQFRPRTRQEEDEQNQIALKYLKELLENKP